ncbi:MAG TPA: hypothetical protein VJV22_08305 [Acidobacteriaceae bacterium]|nr:hypothetical protein [Acidobacteriaceae bacterium]
MRHKKQHAGMQGGKARSMSSSRNSRSQGTAQRDMGGREFGSEFEPMQAEMASGNEGLAETSRSSQQTRGNRRMKKAA